jgi:uncharacterized membrane protein
VDVGSHHFGRNAESFARVASRRRARACVCFMVSWDLSQDPVWSTILRAWVWLRVGAYFGVPLTNFFDWFLTIYVIYQSFAVFLRRHSSMPALSVSH